MKKIITAFMFLIISAAFNAYGEAPNLLTYQGRLKEAGQAVTGNRTVEIFLCNAESGPTCHSSGAQSVAVSNGLFRSTFTIPAAANFGAGNWWLEIKVGADTLAPREQFTSNAYALFAATAAYASNITAAEGSNGVTISSNLYVSGGFAVGASTLVVINGNVGVNTADPTYPLHIQAAAGAEDALYLKDSGQNVSLVMMSQVNYDAKIEAPNTGAGLTMEIGSVPSVHISSAYNAGFGTMNPAARVHISSAAGESGNMLIISTGSSNVIRMTGAGEIYANTYYGNGSALTGVVASGDSLGNHIATQTLQMGSYGVNTSSDITAARYQIDGSTVLAKLPGVGSLGVGLLAGKVSTGDNNSFFGYEAGYLNTVGSGNFFAGYRTGDANAVGSNNSFAGTFAGANVGGPAKGGSANSLFGYKAGYGTYGDSFSSAAIMGYQAGLSLVTGSDNILIGFQAGDSLTTGARNIIIGYDQDATAATISNELNIGGLLRGNLSAGSIGIGFANTIPLAALDVKSTGTALTQFAQIWRDGGGNIISSVSATGVMMASKYIGDGSQLSGITATSYSGTLPVANGGTGVTTITGMIKGNGTGAFTGMTGTANRAVRWSDANTIAASALITDNGTNVGIGAALPDQELTVAGDISQTGVIISSGAGNNYFAGRVGIGTNTPDSGVELHVSGGNIGLDNSTYLRWKNSGGGMSDVMWVGADDNVNLRLPNPSSYTFFDSGSNPLFVILNSGQIGVNTATPGYALDVSGSFNASSSLCLAGNCKSSWASIDNLGNHVATQALLMSVYAVNSSSHISAAAYQVNGSTALAAFASMEGVSVGLNTGPQNSGTGNTFIGHNTGLLNTVGAGNTFVGRGAGATNSSGGQNVFVGKDAGITNMTGSANVVVGVDAASVSTLFSSSTLIGYQSGYNMGSSVGNILIGYKAGYNIDTGTGNIIIGFEKDTPASNTDSHLNIGGAIFGDLITGSIGIGTNSPMAALDVKSTGTLVNEYAQIWRASDGTIVASMTSTGNLYAQVPAPAAAVNITAQSTAGTTEEVLMSYTLPANTLSFNGKGVKVRAWGITAANANTKTIRLRFGGLTGSILVTNDITTAPNAFTWNFESIILRAGASVQKAVGTGTVETTPQTIIASGPAQNDGLSIDIVVSGETPTAAGDITAEGLIVESIN